MWNLSNKAETSAIFKSTQKNSFSIEDLSDSGKWFYQMMTGKNPVSTLKNTTGNFDTKDFTISAKVIHQWQDGGKYYYNYQVSIKNTSSDFKTQWNISLPFNENITLVNG